MKCCLVAVNSKYIHENLAVRSLQAYAASGGHDCDVLESTINQVYEDVLESLFLQNVYMYAFSVYIWNRKMVLRLIRDIKRIKPDAVIWLGGPEVSFDAADIMAENPEINGVMTGEGEETFAALLEAYEKGSRLCDVRGIVFRDENGRIKKTDSRPLMDMNGLIFPYENREFDPGRIYYYESSRGCPFSCSYCLSSTDRKVRFRDIGLVKHELDRFLEKNVRQVKFVDRTFNCDRDRARHIWSYIKEHDNGTTNFHFEVDGQLLEEPDIELLCSLRPGQVQLEIGVQTTNPKTLDAIHRKSDLRRLSDNVSKLIRAHNIHIHLDLIAGLPCEGTDSFRNSFNDVYGLRPTQLQLGFLKFLKGTEMCRAAEKEVGWEYFAEPPYQVMQTPWIAYPELLVLKGISEMVETYYNSCQFERTMQELEKCFPDPFEMYLQLSAFYRGKCYNEAKHSRMRLYEILLEFIEEKGCDRSLFIPLLLEDAYAREKPGHFPEWAAGYERPLRYDYERRDPLTNNAYPGE